VNRTAEQTGSRENPGVDGGERFFSGNGSIRHVYWIAGGSCSGKSSIADELAQAHGLKVLHTDAILHKLFERADARQHPVAHELWPVFKQGFRSWMRLPLPRLFEATYELFPLLLDDVRALGSSLLVVEGTAINLVAAVQVIPKSRIVCLTATDRFLRSQGRSHPLVKQRYPTWDNPEQALATLIEGHIRITHEYVAMIPRCEIKHVVTDEGTRFQAKLLEVQKHFGLI
jgi:hypothetical protein